MELRMIKDRGIVEKLVLLAEDSTAPMLRANIAYILSRDGCRLLLPGLEKKVNGFRVLLSFGRDMDGGPAILRGSSCSTKDHQALLKHVSSRYASIVLTLRPWIKTHRLLLKASQELRDARIGAFLYPRVLRIPSSFEDYLAGISKKARNRYRYFLKHGGRVEEVDPLKHVRGIAAVNYSSPVRQGRLLPRGYLDPKLIVEGAARWSELRRIGVSSFYVAWIDGRIAGYAYIPHLNGHAYASRFLVHSSYLRLGVGNGLLLGIIRDLSEKRKAHILQYGYWRNVNPGINWFLAQHGFKALSEPLLFIGRGGRLFSATYGRWTSISTRIPQTRGLWIWQIVSGRTR